MVVFQNTQPQSPEIQTFCAAGTVTQAIKQKVNKQKLNNDNTITVSNVWSHHHLPQLLLPLSSAYCESEVLMWHMTPHLMDRFSQLVQ